MNGINQIRSSTGQLDLSKGLNTAGLAANLEKDLTSGATKAVTSAEKAMLGKGEVIGAGLSTKIMSGFNPGQMGSALEKNLTASLGKVQQSFAAQAGMGGQILSVAGPIGILAAATIGLGLAAERSAEKWEKLNRATAKAAGVTTSSPEMQALMRSEQESRMRTGIGGETYTTAATGLVQGGVSMKEVTEGAAESTGIWATKWKTDAASVAKSMTELGSKIKPETQSWKQFIDQQGTAMETLANKTGTSATSIMAGMTRMAPIMSRLNVPAEAVPSWQALVAVMERAGIPAERVGKSVQQAVQAMTGKNAPDFAKLLGLDTSQFEAQMQKDVIGTIQKVATALKDLPLQEQTELLQKLGGGKDIVSLMGDPAKAAQLATAIKQATDAANSGKTAQTAWATSLKDAGTQGDRFKEILSVMLEKIGTPLMGGGAGVLSIINDTLVIMIKLGEQAASAIGGAIDKAKEWVSKNITGDTDLMSGAGTGFLSNDWFAKTFGYGGEIAADSIGAGIEAKQDSITKPIVDAAQAGGELGGAAAAASFADKFGELTKSGVSSDLASVMVGMGTTYDEKTGKTTYGTIGSEEAVIQMNKWAKENEDTSERTIRTWENLGKTYKYVMTAVDDLTARSYNLVEVTKDGEKQLANANWQKGRLAMPEYSQEDLIKMAGIETPFPGTPDYYRMTGDLKAAEEAAKRQAVNYWDTYSKEDSHYFAKFKADNEDLWTKLGEGNADKLFQAWETALGRGDVTLTESMQNILDAVSGKDINTDILKLSIEDAIKAGVISSDFGTILMDAVGASLEQAFEIPIANTKDWVVSEIKDMASQAADAWKGGLTQTEADALIAFEPMLTYMKTTFPEAFKEAGGEGKLQLIAALRAGGPALDAVMAALGQQSGEAFTTALGASVDPTKIAAQKLLSSPEFWSKSASERDALIKQYVGDTHVWFSNFLKEETSYNQQLISQGLKASTESWDRARQLFSENRDWFNKEQTATMQDMGSFIDYVGDIANVSNRGWDSFWKHMSGEDATNKLQDNVNKATVGYDQLKDVIQDCADCAISDFGAWQEAQEGLFSGAYLGEGGAAYEAWETDRIQAIADVQEAMRRTGGIVVGRDYTQLAEELSRQTVTIEANTTPMETAVQDAKTKTEGTPIKIEIDANTDPLVSVATSAIASISSQSITIPIYGAYQGETGGYGGATNALGMVSSPGFQYNTYDFLYGSYQEGINYVPKTGPYLLHQGERVTPDGGGSGGNTIILGDTIIEGNVYGVDDFEERMDARDAALVKKFNSALKTMAKAG